MIMQIKTPSHGMDALQQLRLPRVPVALDTSRQHYQGLDERCAHP